MSTSHPDPWYADHVTPQTPSAGQSGAQSSPSRPSAPGSGKSGPPIKVASSTAGAPPGVSPAAGQTPKVECTPRVSYFRKAFQERVYPLVVDLTAPKGQAQPALPAGASMEVRPFLPGAMVWPEKRTVPELGKPARFWVMPVARGKLAHGYVTVSSGNGEQQIPLTMKVRRGRGWLFRTCVWLTILVPIALFVLRCLPPELVTARYTAMRPSPARGESVPMPFQGRAAVEAWLKDVSDEARAVPAQDRSVRQWLMVLLGNTGGLLPQAYDVYEIMLQETMLAEPAALAVMLLITLLVGWWTGPKRRTVAGKPILFSKP